MAPKTPKDEVRSYDRQLSPEARFAEQRQRIVRAATEVYGEKGLHATRIEDVVARAAVSKRTLYEHFRDLPALRFAVFEHALSSTLVMLGELASDESLPDRLHSVLRAMFQAVVDHPNLARIIAYEYSSGEPRNTAMRNQVRGFFVAMMMQATAADHADGRVPRPPDELVMNAMVAMFQGLVAHFLDNDPSEAMRGVDVALEIYRSVYPWRPKISDP
jgi:AcrR family transcriptional regulator